MEINESDEINKMFKELIKIDRIIFDKMYKKLEESTIENKDTMLYCFNRARETRNTI